MESSERLKLSINCLAYFSFSWLILGWITWVAKGCKTIMPFISDLDLYQPEDTIFTLGAMGSGIFAAWCLFELHAFRHKMIVNNSHGIFWIIFNYVALVPGIVAATACFRIGTAPWNVDMIAHGTFAMDIFYGGVYWGVLSTILTIKLLKGHESFFKIISIRVFTASVAVISLWQMIATVANVWVEDFDWDAWIELTNNMQEFCTNNTYPLLNEGALWEWLLIGSILATVLTFKPEINLFVNGEEE